MAPHYSAEKIDLVEPSQRADFFANGLPQTDAAICAQMAWLAYCRRPQDYKFDRERISKILNTVDFEVGDRFFESESLPQGKGTHCFLAYGKRPATQDLLAILAFRGADPGHFAALVDESQVALQPWELGGQVRRGLPLYLLEVWRELDPILELLESIRYRTFFTGHGLGGALATLAASVRKPDRLYTFGSPMVGDAEFAAKLVGVENYRYVNCCDLVARIPQKTPGFVHLGNPYYIDSEGNTTYDPKGRDQVHAAIQYKISYSLKPENLPDRELADHSPVNYVSAIK